MRQRLLGRGSKHAQKLAAAAVLSGLVMTVFCKKLLRKGLWILEARSYGN